MIEVVTMRFGDKYGPHYATRLYHGVARNLSLPFRFTVFTDNPLPLHPNINLKLAPDLGGWWNHLYAFSGWTDNRQMLIDVDDVIVGSLDEMAMYEGRHALNSDVYRPENVDGGFQLIPPRDALSMYQRFLKDAEQVRARYYSDKEYYQVHLNNSPRVEALFPGQWVSYKVHCATAGLPNNARVVGFHGQPKPGSVVDPWVAQHWRDEEVTHAD